MFRVFQINRSLGQAQKRLFSKISRVATEDVILPKTEMKQLLHFIHPDKFVGDNFKEAREMNQHSLSQLNTIMDFGNTVFKEVTRNGEWPWFVDRQVAKDAPLPCKLEFWCLIEENKPLKRISIQYIMPPRPSASVCLKRTKAVLVSLMDRAGIDTNHLKVGPKKKEEPAPKKEESTQSLFQAAKDHKKPLDNIFDTELKQYLRDENDEKVKELYHAIIKRKFEKQKIFFHPRLSITERQTAWQMIVGCASLYGNDMMLTKWVDVPIVFCPDWDDALKCPSHVVALPYDVGSDEIVTFIQSNIVEIMERFRAKKRDVRFKGTGTNTSQMDLEEIRKQLDPRENQINQQKKGFGGFGDGEDRDNHYGGNSRNTYRNIRGM